MRSFGVIKRVVYIVTAGPWRHIVEWTYRSSVLDVGTRWRWMVSFTPLPLYSRGKSPRYPLYRRMGGPQSPSGHCGEEKNLAPAGNRTRAYQLVARCCKVFHFHNHVLNLMFVNLKANYPWVSTHQAIKAYRWNGFKLPRSLDSHATCLWVVRFTHQKFCLWRKRAWWSYYKRLGLHNAIRATLNL
jgi:hypothetical protein